MTEDRFMRRAIELAQPHHPHPNPRVGAVIVDDSGRLLGEGAHVGPGHDHAEIMALDQAGDGARGATMYVTLEPCTHQGRTPPCVDAIVAAGIDTVVVGCHDPDPRVAGSGISRLIGAEVTVKQGVLADQVHDLDPAYFHHRETGMPLVTMKYAMTLDGAAAALDATSQWITSEQARSDAHLLRARVDAVMVGAGTLRADDPLLTVRVPSYEGPQPTPVVIAGNTELPVRARIWDRKPIVFSTREATVPAGDVVVVQGEQGRPDPSAVCAALVGRGLLDVLLEGGPTLAGQWWSSGVVSRGVAYVGAKVGGGRGISPLAGVFSTIDQARVVRITAVRSLGPDVRIDFE